MTLRNEWFDNKFCFISLITAPLLPKSTIKNDYILNLRWKYFEILVLPSDQKKRWKLGVNQRYLAYLSKHKSQIYIFVNISKKI